jgi:hypothetical protein
MNIAELYFRPKRWEHSGKIYQWIGIRFFKRLVMRLGNMTGQSASRPNNYFLWQKTFDGLRQFEKKTRYNELMHLAGIIIPMIGMLMGGVNYSTRVVLWGVLFVNIYPYFLQRYNRARIYRLLSGAKSAD